jgi:hypothetical protein
MILNIKSLYELSSVCDYWKDLKKFQFIFNYLNNYNMTIIKTVTDLHVKYDIFNAK